MKHRHFTLAEFALTKENFTMAEESAMLETFVEVQKSMAVHRKCLLRMLDLRRQLNEAGQGQTFFDTMLTVLHHCLLVYKREPAVERLARFFGALLAEINDSTLSLGFLQALLPFSGAADRAVRFRVCQLCVIVLAGLGAEADVPETTWRALEAAMLPRLRDKHPVVRVEAVRALSRMQSPPQEGSVETIEDCCPVLKEYVRLVQSDNSKDVRRAVLDCICITQETLPIVLERVRDDQPLVRAQAFATLSAKVDMRALAIAQRVELIDAGLNDREESVRAACLAMVYKGWLVECMEGDVLALLRALDVEAYEAECLVLVQALLKHHRSLGEAGAGARPDVLAPLFDEEQLQQRGDSIALDSERALYWRAYVEFALVQRAKKRHGGELDGLLPSVTDFTFLLRGYYSQAVDLFVVEQPAITADDQLAAPEPNAACDAMTFATRQLLFLGAHLDLSDEAGRRVLSSFLTSLFVSHSPATSGPLGIMRTLTEPALALLMHVHGDAAAQVNVVTAIADQLLAAASAPVAADEDDEGDEGDDESAPIVPQNDWEAAAKRETDLKVAALRVRMQEQKDAKASSIANEDFAGAAAARDSLEALENAESSAKAALRSAVLARRRAAAAEARVHKRAKQPEVSEEAWVRALTVIAHLFASTTLSLPAATGLARLRERAVLAGIASASPLIRNAAVRALGTSCLVDAEPPRAFVFLLLQVLRNDQDALQATALTALFDVVLRFGALAFELDAEADQVDQADRVNGDDDEADEAGRASASRSLLAVLMPYLNDASAELRTIAVEGFARLLLFGRVGTFGAQALSQMLVLYFSPTTAEDRLRQALSVFLPVYAQLPFGPRLLEQSTLTVVRTIVRAPPSSPLATIALGDVAALMLRLVPEPAAHARLGLAWANTALELGTDAAAKRHAKALCKALSLLDCTGNSARDEGALGALAVLGTELLGSQTDRLARGYLHRFLASVAPPGAAPAAPKRAEGSESADDECDDDDDAGGGGAQSASSAAEENIPAAPAAPAQAAECDPVQSRRTAARGKRAPAPEQAPARASRAKAAGKTAKTKAAGARAKQILADSNTAAAK